MSRSEMGKVNIVLDDDIEWALRTQIRRRGDLSRIVNEALRNHLNEKEKVK